jgi:hypothetical protein
MSRNAKFFWFSLIQYTAGFVLSLMSSWTGEGSRPFNALFLCFFAGWQIFICLYILTNSEFSFLRMVLLLVYCMPPLLIGEYKTPAVMRKYDGTEWMPPYFLALGILIYVAVMWYSIRAYLKSPVTTGD